MPVIGGSNKPQPNPENDDPYKDLGVKDDGTPVYREGEQDGGKNARREDGTKIGRGKTKEDAAQIERDDRSKRRK